MFALRFQSTDVSEEEGLVDDSEVVVFFFHLEQDVGEHEEVHLGPLSADPLVGVSLVDEVALLLAELEDGDVSGEDESILDPHHLGVDGGADSVHGARAGDGRRGALLPGGTVSGGTGRTGLHATAVDAAGFALG